MANPAEELSRRIANLLDERQQHAEALERIDATLAQISSALGVVRRGRPSGKFVAPAAVAMTEIKIRRRRGRFSVSAEDTVLNFVKESKSPPATQEINRYWKAQGRKGTADNTLTLMVKNKKLRREKQSEGRGSTYTVA